MIREEEFRIERRNVTTVGRQVYSNVDRKKVEHFPLRSKLGSKVLGRDSNFRSYVHDLVVLILVLHRICNLIFNP